MLKEDCELDGLDENTIKELMRVKLDRGLPESKVLEQVKDIYDANPNYPGRPDLNDQDFMRILIDLNCERRSNQ